MSTTLLPPQFVTSSRDKIHAQLEHVGFSHSPSRDLVMLGKTLNLGSADLCCACCALRVLTAHPGMIWMPGVI